MSARKLSRFAGLVFVLAAVFGGVGAASAVAEHETEAVAASTASPLTLLDMNWG